MAARKAGAVEKAERAVIRAAEAWYANQLYQTRYTLDVMIERMMLARHDARLAKRAARKAAR